MDWLAAAAVGGLGGIAIEAYDIITALKWHGVAPWKVGPDTVKRPARRPDLRPGEEKLPAPGRAAYTVAVVLSTLVSATLAGVLAATYDYATVPAVSFAVGMGAIGSLQRLAKLVPLLVANLVNSSLQAMVATRRPEDKPPADTKEPSVEPEPASEPAPTETPAEQGEHVTEGTTP
ncbi:hypothetical protein [Streptomyces sp. R33]|uniref:Uncharacterized protein n=1 Tax=Streptomyces sp. R33 TaxID=3238629 RepID=A0AB39XUX4_9ACTN